MRTSIQNVAAFVLQLGAVRGAYKCGVSVSVPFAVQTARSCASWGRRVWACLPSYQYKMQRRHLMVILSLLCLQSLPSAKSTRAAHAEIDGPELRGLAQSDDGQPPFRDAGNGLKVQEIQEGSGDTAVSPGAIVSVKYVLRRSNGYYIDASYGFDRFENFVFRSNSGDVIEGFDKAVLGMTAGGRRRFVVPAALGYKTGTGKSNPGPIPPEWGARRSLASHAKEPLIFEVQVVKVKQLN